MLRTVIAVVVGYVAMMLLVAALLSLVYVILGADGTFRAESWRIGGLWTVAWFVAYLVAALAGGVVCRVITSRRAAVTALAVASLLLIGLAQAGQQAKEPPEGVRGPNVGVMDAMGSAVMPMWVSLLTPPVAMAGVLMGGLAGKRPAMGTG